MAPPSAICYCYSRYSCWAGHSLRAEDGKPLAKYVNALLKRGPRVRDGSTFWAQAHCSQHNALIDRIENVADVPWDQQVQQAEQGKAVRNQQAQVNTGDSHRATRCAQLAAERAKIESRYARTATICDATASRYGRKTSAHTCWWVATRKTTCVATSWRWASRRVRCASACAATT